MAVESHKSRRGVYQRRDGVLTYAREVYEVRGLPLDVNLTSGDVIALAQAATPSPLPVEGTPMDGLPMADMVVESKLSSGSQRRIIVTWGRRGSGSAVARAVRYRDVGVGDVVQPYVVYNPDNAPSGPFYSRVSQRLRARGRFQTWQGRYISAGTDENAIYQTAASYKNMLYTVDGQPALFRGVQTDRRVSGELWVWTIFESTGWLPAVPADAIEPGSRPVAELPPLWEYGTVDFQTGTPAVEPDSIYTPGGNLWWQ